MSKNDQVNNMNDEASFLITRGNELWFTTTLGAHK